MPADRFTEALRELDASVDGYMAAFPAADAESIRTNLAFVNAYQLWSAYDSRPASGDNQVTQGQFALLRLLFFAEGKRMAQSEIARTIGVTGTYVTRLIDALEEKGLVERVISTEDRRVTYAALRADGEARCRRRLPGAIRAMEGYFREFSLEEKQTLQYLLSKFCTGVAAMQAARDESDE